MTTPRHKRILAHCIVHQGAEHRLSVADIWQDGNGWHVTVKPFLSETEGTVFYNGTIEIYGADRHSPFSDGSQEPPTIINR